MRTGSDAHAAEERLVVLANTEHAAEGLLLRGLVPPGVNDDYLGSHGEVEPETAAAKRGKEDARVIVVGEALDGFVAGYQGHFTLVLWFG